MKNIILAATLLGALSTHALAQTTTDTTAPAVATPGENNTGMPVEGENSFTEAQAMERIAAAGFTDVSKLTLDDKGIWRGSAMKDGKSTSVSIDFQGNVFAR